MSFAELFVIAVIITAWTAIATAVIAGRELQSRRSQRRDATRVHTPAYGLMSDESQAREPNAELLHAVRRLG